MADVRSPISYSSSRRPRSSSVVQRGESSVSPKRARLSAPPRRRPLLRRTPLSFFPEDDDDDFIINDGSHRWDNDDDREEDEQQRRNQDERGSSGRDDGFSGGSDDAGDVVEEEAGGGGGGVEEQPAAEEEDSDDDCRPISMSRPRTQVHRGSTSTAAASMPAAAPPARPEPSPPPSSSSSSSDSSSVIKNVTVANSSAFDCSICYLPLKSPIFQCTVGHVVCSPCHGKLGEATSCHVCRVPIPDGYFRCNAMEQVVDSIRVPCPHAAHGCAVKPAYHERDDHARTCAHKPWQCPAEGCDFAGSVQTTLLGHLIVVHGWHYTARITGASDLDVHLRKGFNVVVTTGEDEHYTLVLKVEQPAAICNAITAFCIHPSHTGIVTVGLSYYRRWRRDSGLFISKYLQSSELDVVCTDLSNGVPGSNSCFPFLVPRWSATPGGEDGDDISVTVNYIRRDIGSMFSVWSTQGSC